MKRFVALSSISVIAVLGLTAGVADAGEPASQACVGESLSALAMNQPAPGAFGGGVRGFAQAPDARPGLGDGIQALQAGVVPDDVVPNTCNDA
ncbi:MAG: hypothetical protein ABWZ15_02070 [Acidimicrobiia bacterium]